MPLRFNQRLAATIALILSAPGQVFALDEIYSPNVEYREFSLEYNASRTFDTHSDKNNAQGHEIAFEAGVTPHLAVQANLGFVKDPDAAAKLEQIGFEGRYQFFEQGEYWLDPGLLVSYNADPRSHQPDSLEAKLLLQKDIGMVTTTMNTGFAQNIGVYSRHTGGPDYVLLWNTRYRYNEYFQPGVELQSDLGQGRELGHFQQQEHYLGPAVYGKLFGRFGYQIGYFWGLSDASAQSAARALVEYEWNF